MGYKTSNSFRDKLYSLSKNVCVYSFLTVHSFTPEAVIRMRILRGKSCTQKHNSSFLYQNVNYYWFWFFSTFRFWHEDFISDVFLFKIKTNNGYISLNSSYIFLPLLPVIPLKKSVKTFFPVIFQNIFWSQWNFEKKAIATGYPVGHSLAYTFLFYIKEIRISSTPFSPPRHQDRRSYS